MSDPVEYVASNGHAVLLDSADWIALRPMLEAGVRLQSVAERGAPKVILREHARGQKPQRTMLLSKVLLGANESQCIRMLNGPLDHRRESLRVVEDGRRSGWASHVHAQMRAGDSVVCAEERRGHRNSHSVLRKAVVDLRRLVTIAVIVAPDTSVTCLFLPEGSFMQIQVALATLASIAMLLFGSTMAHADPHKDESRGKERHEGRGFESRGERKHEYKDGGRKYEYKDGGRKYEYKDDGKYEYKDRRGKYEHKGDDKRSHREGRGSWFHEHGYANLGVPDGHLPPPGECRIWYPGRPAGHQPPPGRCGRLSRQVPAGAWLMRRPDAEPQYVDVTVYDQRRPGVVLNVGIFDAHTGSFIRIDGAR